MKITDIVTYLLKNVNNYNCEDQIEILKKINLLYQIFYEDDDYGINYKILSGVNKKIATLYLSIGDLKSYNRYIDYAIEFENSFNLLSENYEHSSILFKKKGTIF